MSRSAPRYGDETTPLAIAHRGGAAMAPENTLDAFALSVALGVRYLETDVKVTADGELMCFHDETLERVMRNGARRIISMRKANDREQKAYAPRFR